ncbi:unnamed protein product [Parascedosporium putredinis]|uniref:Dol-P-Glc:Glc(2)Man(9)GlcNAc(2)-PP-Dol alpha-1,2-glucosyltransferase n=1 Tax=Parascedosporium putredinis TaxID=1442378 RepID=A0A9P1M647_9PEZI|nr:unnamed protein product [Parascedosporium putredinis]CAI7988000.1 unnamed protein product [Parascedosporium putredinis]
MASKDEIFHIPQAQRYCEGRWTEWDDKITTPPGLYAVSVFASRVKILGFQNACSARALRSVNVWCISLLGAVAALCRSRIEQSLANAASKTKAVSFYSLHSGFNIALFPVLFFFSGLYYTDVLSTLAVLVAYSNHLNRMNRRDNSLVSDVWTVVLGLFSLTMRQTNVFWVVVYMGGLEAVHALKTLSSHRVPSKAGPGSGIRNVEQVVQGYTQGAIHDLPSAGHGQMMFSSPLLAWVSRRDKSNHVATVHLAQMLYIWPLVAFFSTPLFPAVGIHLLDSVFGCKPSVQAPNVVFKSEAAVGTHAYTTGVEGASKTTSKRSKGAGKADLKPLAEPHLVVLFAGVSASIVKYNTIIHPFTLADNRHYMFYIFRYTIRRPGLFRFYLIVPYIASAVLAYTTLSLGDSGAEAAPSRFDNHPYALVSSTFVSKGDGKSPFKRGSLSNVTTLEDDEGSQLTIPTSNALLLLVATALSLITAPLVEPRYFIIPWVMWRLLVPAWSTRKYATCVRSVPLVNSVASVGTRFDLRLVFESLWFLAINIATMSIFLLKPYQWRAEDGTLLDEGRLQRAEAVGQAGAGLKTQLVKAEAIVAPYALDNAKFEVLLFSCGGPATDVPFVGTHDVPEALATAVAAPTSAARRNGNRDTASR